MVKKTIKKKIVQEKAKKKTKRKTAGEKAVKTKVAKRKVIKKKVITKKHAEKKAKILRATLRRIDDIFKKHKPQGLGFSDTDVVIVKVKTSGGKTFDQDFYCRLKGDGTIGHSITKASEKRQQNLRNFVNKYISKEKKYNVRENISKWTGKEVELEEIEGGFIIKI